MREYDPITHIEVPDWMCLMGGICTVLVGGFLLVALIWGLPASGDAKNWQTKYYELSCKSRGLELNTRNKLWLCQDPQTKALHEVD